jgi:hypothetical protein
VALFELTFDVSFGSWDASKMAEAASAAGFPDAAVDTERPGVFSVKIRHTDSKFDRGALLADEILPFLPDGSKLISVRQAALISELDEEDIAAILSAEWNQQAG